MGLKEEVKEAELVVYGRGCPNCGGFISDRRLRLGVPCSSCLREIPKDRSVYRIYEILKSTGKVSKYEELYNFKRMYEDLIKFFKRCVGNEPWSIQKLWLKRIAKNASFAMIAPTGVGKTTFGAVVALYLAMKGFRSYLIVPTTTLAIQLEKKLEELSERADIVVRTLVIHSKLKKSEKKLREDMLKEKNSFDILVTTSNYLLRNPDKILKHDFKFIFVDDVDAVLRGSKAIDLIIKLAGYSDRDIELAFKVIKLKQELAYKGGEDYELLERIRKIEDYLDTKRRKLGKILIISSATGSPRGIRVKLFKELMGFEIGARPEFIRNIVDAFDYLNKEDPAKQVASVIQKLGRRGGLVYVPIDKGIEYANELADKLNKLGIKAEAMHSKNIKAIERFIADEVEVLVGVATYYGVLVRGIDLPEVIRYAIFVGVPRHKIGLKLKDVKAQDILRLLPILRDTVEDDELRRKLEGYMVRLRRMLRRAGSYLIQRLNELLASGEEPKTRTEKEFIDAFKLIKDLVSRKEILERILENPDIATVKEDEEIYILIPDAPTYIQASGRTSRLFLGGISQGFSLLLVDDERLLKGLERRLRWMIDDFSFKPLKEVNLDEIISKIDHDRELIRIIRLGKIPKFIAKEKVFELKTALLVVESPNKARTIARFFGRPSVREYGKLRVYEVNLGNYTLLITASGGHIYDLIQEIYSGVDNIFGVAYTLEGKNNIKFVPVYTTLKRCLDKGHQFAIEPPPGEKLRCPSCQSDKIYDAYTAVEAIRDVALEVDEILVGTDPDTEGEKIAFDIVNITLPYNNNVKRIEFHEVTRRAIINAINNPRDINLNLVKAQLIRRIEDRWIGFSLSKQLQTEFWQQFCGKLDKLQHMMGMPDVSFKGYRELCQMYRDRYRNLSAGRVQTPVLGWVIDAYEKYKASHRYYIVFSINGNRIEVPIKDDSLARRIKKVKDKEAIIKVTNVKFTEEELGPLPPYTTDAALSDINSRLRIPSAQAMKILQDLFEMGFITYHRTDSTRISEVGIGVAREYLSEELGDRMKEYFYPRRWGEGGAHEGIRPTRPIDAATLRKLISEGIIEPVRRLTRDHYRVYDLIFRRFIASQCRAAKVVKEDVEAEVVARLGGGEEVNLGKIVFSIYTNIVFDGFLRYYSYIKVTPELNVGTYRAEDVVIIRKSEHPLHTEATLIKTMREREIGRPSTYAKIVDTLFKRRYIHYRGKERSGGIVPSILGMQVYKYLMSKYRDLVSEERTRMLERRMREVEEGKTDYNDVVKELHKELENEVGIRIGV